MKPSPQSQGFIYKNQTPSAISDQRQQPSGRGYECTTGKAINCQSLYRSTSQSTTTITTHHPPPLSSHPSSLFWRWHGLCVGWPAGWLNQPVQLSTPLFCRTHWLLLLNCSITRQHIIYWLQTFTKYQTSYWTQSLQAECRRVLAIAHTYSL